MPPKFSRELEEKIIFAEGVVEQSRTSPCETYCPAGNPIQKVINRFEKALAEYSYMHKARLTEIEEDSQVLLQIWSTYHLFAFFPFPNSSVILFIMMRKFQKNKKKTKWNIIEKSLNVMCIPQMENVSFQRIQLFHRK